ncbi:GNAT family N-acetyltransferase [Butyricimonas faecihominis]|uniref:GNAT family N-acetyltransferase n=1 Tax=Butyricimonas faecihominis TaxID=1472416 RepID=UPI0032C1A459
MEYMKLSMEDIKDIVDIHKISFKNFFLSSLGTHFLKVYYKAVLKSQLSVCIGGKENGILKGFCVGTTLARGFHKGLLKDNFVSFLWSLGYVCMVRPISIIRLFRNLEKRSSIVPDDGNYAELLSIAVLPNASNKGIGHSLLREFEKKMKSMGVSKVVLTTDSISNDNVINFYQKNDFKVLYKFVTYPKREMYKLIKEL